MTMCDCSGEEKNGNAFGETSIATVRIFEKCTKLPVQHADYGNEPVQHSRKVQNGANEILVIPIVSSFRIKNDGALVSSTKSSSSESSNDSIKSDDFMKAVNLDCAIDCEDAAYNTKCICNGKSTDEDLDVEQTLAIIKPEAIENLNAIENVIYEEGFEIQQTKRLRMTCEQVSEFYADSYGTIDFNHIVAYMASGPIDVKVLAKKNAIKNWRSLMGPTKVTEARLYFPDSIRARYGRKGAHYKNCVHGSSNRNQAEREIHFFFPDLLFIVRVKNFIEQTFRQIVTFVSVVLEPLLRGQSAEKYLRESINCVLLEGLAICCKVKPFEPVLWLANWLLCNVPRAPKLASNNHSD